MGLMSSWVGGGGGMKVDERVLCPVGGPWRGLETPPGKPPLNFLPIKTKSNPSKRK